MNDPNGLIEHAGLHHLFFQHNPAGPVFGRMHWGHATSPDLVRWTEQPLALTPGDAGDYDVDGCWSGCALALPDGRVGVLYSGHRDGVDLPALAWAGDAQLTTWVKWPANPVVSERPAVAGLTDLRDHAIHRVGQSWRQVLAGGRDRALLGERSGPTSPQSARGGLLVSYLSSCDDLTTWTYEGVLLDGRAAELPGEVWECPDLFAVAGQPPGHVVVLLSWYTRDATDPELVVSDVIWSTGALVDGTFIPTRYGRLDLGDRLYAPQSYWTSDDRRIMFGWLRTQLDPASAEHATVGAASLPRLLQVVDGRLVQAPAAEVDTLIRESLGVLDVDRPALALPHPLDALELVVSADAPAALAAAVVELTGPDGHVRRVDLAAFGTPSTWASVAGRWREEQPSATCVRVLVDGGLVEVFSDDGRAAATSELALASVSTLTLARAAPGTSVALSSISAGPDVLD